MKGIGVFFKEFWVGGSKVLAIFLKDLFPKCPLLKNRGKKPCLVLGGTDKDHVDSLGGKEASIAASSFLLKSPLVAISPKENKKGTYKVLKRDKKGT